MLRALLCSLLCSCFLGVALAEGYDAPQPTCAPGRETLTVTNTHVNTVVDLLTVHDYFLKHQLIDVTSVVLVPSPLVASDILTPLPAKDVSTTTTHLTNTIYRTTTRTIQVTAAATTTSRLVATEVQVVGTVTLTMTKVKPEPVTETHTAHDMVTAFTTSTVTTETHSATIKTAARYDTLTATSVQAVPVSATRTVTSTSTSTVEATVTLTQYDLVTLCYSPMITYQH